MLVNGSPSRFFKASRGVIQGFPLSPFLFLIIVEVLNRMLKEEKYYGSLRGVKD